MPDCPTPMPAHHHTITTCEQGPVDEDFGCQNERDNPARMKGAPELTPSSQLRPAKKQKCPSSSEDSQSQLGSLPESLVCKIILRKFIGDAGHDLLTLLRLAAVSRSWNRRVYGEGALWRRIDFSNVTTSSRLTDRLLLAFLRRVNAKETTEFLCLRNCIRLTGRGIGPLRGSKVLRRIDLLFSPHQGSSASEIDWESIDRTLSSFHPFSRKSFSTGDGERLYPGLVSLQLPKISSGTDKKTREIRLFYSNMIKIFHRNFIAWSKEVKTAEDGFLQCNTCKQNKLMYYFASDFAFRMAISSTCLGPCNHQVECYKCGDFESSVWAICSTTEKLCCDKCQDGSYETSYCSKCPNCNTTVAHRRPSSGDPDPWNREPPMAACSVCSIISCSSCRRQSRCSNCLNDYCAACSSMQICSECDRQFCTSCTRMSSCGACGDQYCDTSGCENSHFQHCVSSSFRRSAFN